MGLIKWWYGAGWLGQLDRAKLAFIKTADKFSIDLLIKTLFAPFRQISAGESGRDIGSKFAVFVDKLMSRTIGCVMRLTMIIVGTISMLLLAAVSLLRLAIWPLLPAMPVFGLILMSTVGAPWTII